MQKTDCISCVYSSPWNEEITDILAVHLHRYLLPLLSDHRLNHIFVVVGFEASHMPSICLRVTQKNAEKSSIEVEYDSLVKIARNNRILDAVWSHSFNDEAQYVFPILSISEPGREHIHAFALCEKEKVFASDVFCLALRTRINEAIRAFRNNSLRILFDDSDDCAPKEFLTKILDTIPIWCGADHSASLILSSSLEAMVMSATGPAQFQIISEKLYVSPEQSNASFDNLASLEFYVNQNRDSGLLGIAFEETRRSKSISLNIFFGEDDGQWYSMADMQESVHRFSTSANRPKEKLTVLLPLIANNGQGENELLGFLSINYFKPTPLSSLASRVLEALAAKLGVYLRRSPFFTLYAQQLWLIECVREEQLAVQRLARKSDPKPDKDILIQDFITRCNALIAKSTDTPCFAISYKTLNPNGDEVLRFVSPHGFTHFGNIELPIHYSEKSSSLSTLALRLNRTITLTGGKEKDGTTEFESSIYVNESTGCLMDARVNPEGLGSDWRPLSDYYKPSRDGSYATIAYPIRMKDEVVGVITVEVNRDTNWIWWMGYGSYLFYRLLANELAADFSLLGMEVDSE